MDKLSTNKMLKSQLTKSRIMDTYLDLMCYKNWDKISVKEICSSANITRGTFYQYFNDIYDLLEQIEEPLLSDLNEFYGENHYNKLSSPSILSFEEDFDCTPPESLIFWLDFCKENKKSMKVLLSGYGDPYFKTKIKKLLTDEINAMMDNDKMPADDLRSHFYKAFLELHFLVVNTWLDSCEDNLLSIDDIIHVINSMRIGASFVSYKNNKVSID